MDNTSIWKPERQTIEDNCPTFACVLDHTVVFQIHPSGLIYSVTKKRKLAYQTMNNPDSVICNYDVLYNLSDVT